MFDHIDMRTGRGGWDEPWPSPTVHGFL